MVAVVSRGQHVAKSSEQQKKNRGRRGGRGGGGGGRGREKNQERRKGIKRRMVSRWGNSLSLAYRGSGGVVGNREGTVEKGSG